VKIAVFREGRARLAFIYAAAHRQRSMPTDELRVDAGHQAGSQ
jgi:hypothetical protein